MLKNTKSAQMSTCRHFRICHVFPPNEKNSKNDSHVRCFIAAKTEEKMRWGGQILDRRADRFDGKLGTQKAQKKNSEKPKSVDRKTNNIDRFVDRQAADVVFGDTLIGSRLSYILRDNDTIDLRDSLSAH